MTEPHISSNGTPAHGAAASPAAALQRQRATFQADRTAATLLEAMPGPAMVLNTRREVVVVNRHLSNSLGVLESSIASGARQGDLFGCRHARETPGGCGTTEACEQCGANRAVLDCLKSSDHATHECRIQTQKTKDGGALDFRAHATFIEILGEKFIILGLEDLSSEKRRHVLERTFFHDLMNACGGMQGLAELLSEPGNDVASEQELKHELCQLSHVVIEQINSQRQLLAAERGELALQIQPVELRPFLENIVALYRHHGVANDRVLLLEMAGSGTLNTDGAILGRVVGNLVKHVLEAPKPGGTVTVRCLPGASTTTISVHNPGLIPREIQVQIFQRSFSTKGGEGRGIGTYSVRLFAEQYLRGQVRFESTADAGTMFEVSIPNTAAALPTAA